MSTRAVKRLTIALWVLLACYCAGFFYHWYTHRPCADVNGKPMVIEGEQACEVSDAP